MYNFLLEYQNPSSEDEGKKLSFNKYKSNKLKTNVDNVTKFNNYKIVPLKGI